MATAATEPLRMLKRLHHAAIICSDYAASRRFYVEVLGLRVIAEHHRAARDSWKLDLALPDGGQIELFSFPIRRRARRIRKPAACATCALPSTMWPSASANSKRAASPCKRSASTSTPAGASCSSVILTGCRWSFTKLSDALQTRRYSQACRW